MTGCSLSSPNSATIANYISIAIKSGEAILSATGVISPQISTYILQGEDWLAFSTLELATTDSDSIKSIRIGEKLAAIAQPDLTSASLGVRLSVLAFSISLSALEGAIRANQPPPQPPTQVRLSNSSPRSLIQQSVESDPPTAPTPVEISTLAKLHKRALSAKLKVSLYANSNR